MHTIQLKWSLNITKGYIDYEKCLRNAIRKEYPAIEIKSFWFQYCLAVRRKCKTIPHFYEYLWEHPIANILFHKYLCLALLPETETAAGYEYLKEKSASFETFNEVVAHFQKVFMMREGPGNFSIERENFGKHVSVNFNKLLQQKFHVADSRFSLADLMSLAQDELAKSSIRFQKQRIGNVQTTRQNEFIKKQYDLFVRNESKDVAQFFATLTFKDNNGAVKEMENYIIGDENEVAEDDDGDYEVMVHEPQDNNDDLLLQQQEEIQQQPQTCVVCLTDPITTMIEPCNHLKFCRDCVDRLMIPQFNEFGEELIRRCPVCRTVITGHKLLLTFHNFNFHSNKTFSF